MLKTTVLASAITNLTDARYFAARGVEWLGFDFDPKSEDLISTQNMKAIKEWVTGVKIVGRFGRQSLAEIENVAGQLDLDAVQLGMFPERESARKLSLPVLKEIAMETSTTEQDFTEMIENHAPNCAAFLFNFEKNGISWKDLCNSKNRSPAFLKALCKQYKIFISIDLSLKMLEEMLEYLQPHGISIKGGAEEKTGFKSFDELDEIFEWLEGG